MLLTKGKVRDLALGFNLLSFIKNDLLLMQCILKSNKLISATASMIYTHFIVLYALSILSSQFILNRFTFMWRRFFTDKKVDCKLSENFSINMQQFVNSIQLAIFIETLDGQLFFSNAICNNEFSNLWDQSTGRLKESLASHSHLINYNKEVINTRKSINFILEIPSNEGISKKVECVKQPYFNECGELIGVITFFHDMKFDSKFETSGENHLEQNTRLINRFSDGHCLFEYFPNGEGRFLELSTNALILLGLTESAVNKTGITGCISPSICDEDRVNIARAFKSAGIDRKKLTCLFRYHSNEHIYQCKFIAVKDAVLNDKSQSTVWHGIFIDLGDVSNQTELTEKLIPPETREDKSQEPSWTLFSYHQIIVDCLTSNLINFKISQQTSINDALNDAENIVFMLDELVQQYGEQWLDYINDLNTNVIVVIAKGENIHYFSKTIVQIPLKLFCTIDLDSLFTHTDSPLTHKPASWLCTPKVLIAEDNPVNQLLIKNQLEQLRYDVTIVCNGKVALEKLNTQKFDAIITDCQMPVIDGLELAKRIRQDVCPTISNLPIIGLTADNSKEMSALAHNAGINHILFKPYKLTDLHEVLLEMVTAKTSAPNNAVLPANSELVVPDLSQWVGVFGTETDAIMMARIFHETLEADLSALERAIEENNTSMCKKTLHRIKGSIVMVKMDMLTQQIEECESFITLENRIDNRLNVLVNNLMQLNSVVQTWIV